MNSKPFVLRAAVEKIILTNEEIARVSGGNGPPPSPSTGSKYALIPSWTEGVMTDYSPSCND